MPTLLDEAGIFQFGTQMLVKNERINTLAFYAKKVQTYTKITINSLILGQYCSSLKSNGKTTNYEFRAYV